jgi:hypothetical protein
MTANFTPEHFQRARHNLSMFVIRQTEKMSKQVGFGYVDCDVAYDDYPSLCAAFAESKRTGLPLKVWSSGSENTIYTSCGANYAFRFWHNCLHAQFGISFDLVGECVIAGMHVTAVAEEFGMHSLERLMMEADTRQQSIFAFKHSDHFPDNQLQFVTDYVQANYLK